VQCHVDNRGTRLNTPRQIMDIRDK